MNSLWIIILIAGAVISIAQKNQQRQRNVGPNDDPTLDPQAEWERRLREILGDSTPPKSEAPEAMPTTTAQQTKQVEPLERPAKPSQTQPATTITRTSAHSSTIQNTNYTAKPSFSSISAQNSAKAATNKANKATQSNPIKEGDITTENIEISRIIDDFTMEKAVIYSEILRPKFEE